MIHSEKIKGQLVTYDCYCSHPELVDNTCPTKSGECEICKHCEVVLGAKDFWHIIKTAREAV